MARSRENDSMAAFRKWCARLGAMISVLTFSLLVPAAAWAATGPGEVVVEAARRRSRGGGGFLTLLCCVAVVGIVGLLVWFLLRNRRRR